MSVRNYWTALISYFSLTLYICLCNREENNLLSQCYEEGACRYLHLTDLVYNISLWQRVFTDTNGPFLSNGCSKQLAAFSFDSKDPSNSLTYLLDSFSKPPTGLFEGNFKWLGDWDECKSLNRTEYVRIVIPIPILLGSSMTSFVGVSVAPDIAICLPADCSNQDDTVNILKHLIELAQPYVPFNISEMVNTSTLIVVPEEEYPIDVLTIVSFGILSVIVSIVILATTIHIIIKLFCSKTVSPDSSSYSPPPEPRLIIRSKYSYYPSEGEINIQSNSLGLVSVTEEPPKPVKAKTILFNAIRSFSLNSNIKILFSPPSNPLHSINCLAGIRSLSMLWIILCRSYLWFLFSGAISDVENILLNTFPLLSFTIVWNGFSAMESLFIISGCLAMFLSLKELNKDKPKFSSCLMYFGRYYLYHLLRVTPTYLILMLFMWKLTPLLGSGPLWSPTVERFIGNCEENWWTNLLYINTFYPEKYIDTCLSWTFYISIEVQFILLSPLFIIPAYCLPAPYSIALPFLLFVLSSLFLVPLFIINEVNPHIAYIINNYLTLSNLSQLLDHARSLENIMVDVYYAKFYFHYSMYSAGLLLGYVLYKIPDWRVHSKREGSFDRKLGLFCIISFPIALFFSILLTFIPNWTLHGLPIVPELMYTLLTAVKPLWAITVVLIILAVALGFGGPIGALLSWGVWAPLSRLTFVVYLIHPIVMMVFFLTLRRTLSYSTLCFSFIIAGLMVVSYCVAALISLFIYLPLKNILGIFRNKRDY